MPIESAVGLLILFGGLAILIFLLTWLSASVDALIPKNATQTETQGNQPTPNKDDGHPVAAAIASYQDQRDAQERDRSKREVITIKVLTATGGFALVAAIATIASDWIFYNQLREMREDRRAWVAPSRGSLVGFIANRAIRPKIDFTNTGKEPAHLIGRYIIPVTFGRDLWYSGVAGQIIIDFQKTWCTPLGLSVNAGGGGISYPNSSDSMQLFSGFGDDDPFFENQIVAGRQIVDGSTVIAFLGCIAYRTLDTIRHTAFCYAYEGRVTDPNFLTVCTVGNYAE